jgi:hypothetical protein
MQWRHMIFHVFAAQKLSLFSCMVSVAAAPIIVGLDPGSTATAGGKVAIAGMLASFGAFTTGAAIPSQVFSVACQGTWCRL